MTSTLQQGTKFSDAFWDNQYKGIEIVTSRLRKSRDTCEEIKKLYELRATIEQDYGERLLKLAQSSRIGEFEENSFAETLLRIPSTLETTARAHIDLAQQLKDHLEAPLDGFLKDQKEIRRVQQQQIENAKQRKTIHESDVARAKEDYVNECQKLKSLEQRLHDTMKGSVDDMAKIEKEIEEQKRTVIVADQVYKRSVDHYNTVNEKFIRDWTASADKFQEMETKRISYLRSTLWSFANMMTSTFSIDEECCDRIRTALEITDVDKDITSFVQHYGTGTQLPPPLVYTSICDPASLLPAPSILPSTSTSFIEKQEVDHEVPMPNVTTILPNHDEELKSVDRQLQKLEVQSISETIPDQPTSAQSNDKEFREIEHILNNNHEPEKAQQTVPPIMMVNRLDEPQPKSDDFSSKVYNALGMKEDQVLEQHQSDLAPISSDPTNEHHSMMGSPDGIKPNKYKPMPNPTYQPSEQHEIIPVIGVRTSSLSHHEKKIQNDEDEDDVEEREYQNRMPRLPPKDEKWVISSIRRPQQLPVKTLNATMFDGSIRNSVPMPSTSAVSSPAPEELELKHQPKLHKPVIPLTIDIPNSVKPVIASEPPQQAAQQVIQEGRKQSHISPVQHDHFNQQPPLQQQNGISEENGMGIRPAPWQENFQTDDHVIKNAGYRGTPMMTTAANAAVPATAYYSYQQQQQQQQRGSVFKQDPYAFEEEPKKRFGIKSHTPVSNTKQQSESTLKSASAKEKEKGRFSLGFFGGNKKEKKKEKEANSNATIIANYQQQQQSRPISQNVYAPSYESNENKSHYSGNQPNGTSQPITESRFICYAKAQWPFEATIEGEMSFHQEEVVGVLRKQADGWWEAERIGNVNTGQRGLVPGNYMIDNYPAP